MSIQTASAGRVLLKFKGNWSALGSYAPLDCTYHSGSTYVCKNNVSSSTTPDQDTTNWQILASGFDAAAVTALKNQITTGSSFAFVIGSTTYTDVESALGALKALYDGEIGTLSSLTTTDKSSLVSAVNEVKSAADTASNKVGTLANLTTTSKTDTVSAINEVKSAADSASTKVGTLSNLTTTAKTDAVSAINEVKGLADSAGSAASTASTKVGTLSNLTTTAKTDAVSAINEVDEKLSKTEVLISIVENGNTCTHTGGISKGQYVNWKGDLYTADLNISVGTTFVSSGGSKNLTAVNNGGFNQLLINLNESTSIAHHNSNMHFTKCMNIVFMKLSGDWKNTLPVSTNTNVGTVPVGFRPITGITVSEQATSGGQLAMTISDNGNISVNNYFSTAQAHDGKYTACWIC